MLSLCAGNTCPSMTSSKCKSKPWWTSTSSRKRWIMTWWGRLRSLRSRETQQGARKRWSGSTLIETAMVEGRLLSARVTSYSTPRTRLLCPLPSTRAEDREKTCWNRSPRRCMKKKTVVLQTAIALGKSRKRQQSRWISRKNLRFHLMRIGTNRGKIWHKKKKIQAA